MSPTSQLRLVNLLMRTGRSVALLFLVLVEFLGWKSRVVEAKPRRIVLDTDMDTDDFFALLYLLKQNPSQFDLKVRFSPFPPAITISANAWTDAGHAVNHVYDILYMMNRDDIPVGVGGDGGILDDGTILPHVVHLMSTALRQVFHAGVPVTLVPLDSTNTIPINEEFFDVFQQQQETFEAQYCFKSLKFIRDNWFDDEFYTVSSS
ncbi:hypothetical protein BHM03_00044695 [Ensete ventricosum]|nr:hypothetical protein BHM03_00044695 [Ensete ventricosum]